MADGSSPSDALEWLNRIWGFVVGVVSTIAGMGAWVSKKLNDIERRVDTMEKDFNARNQQAATNIAVLQAYHQSNTQRLDSIDATTSKIEKKVDRLLENLTNRRDHE